MIGLEKKDIWSRLECQSSNVGQYESIHFCPGSSAPRFCFVLPGRRMPLPWLPHKPMRLAHDVFARPPAQRDGALIAIRDRCISRMPWRNVEE